MPLPNAGMSFTPFDPLPASDLNDLVENIEALADGSGFDANAVGPESLALDYLFKAYASAQTTVNDDTPTKILYATELYDFNNNFAASRYTAPVDGIYHFDASVGHVSASASAVRAYTSLYKNGAEDTRGASHPASSAVVLSWTANGDIQLAAGDYVEVWHYQDSGGSESANNAAVVTYFSGYLVRET